MQFYQIFKAICKYQLCLHANIGKQFIFCFTEPYRFANCIRLRPIRKSQQEALSIQFFNLQ